MAIKYKLTRIHPGRYDVHITDENGEWPQRVGCITGGKNVWMAEAGHVTLGRVRTKKDALERIKAFRAVKDSNGRPVAITVQEQSS